MYKVYLSTSTEYNSFGTEYFGVEPFRMEEIADVVEKCLLQTGEYAVYRNVINMSKQEKVMDSNDVKPDVHIAIHSMDGNKQGIEC